MKTRITAYGGKVQIETVSHLEDLWHDYQYFLGQAKNASQKKDALLEKRYLRASLSSLMAYLDGVVTTWCVGELRLAGETDDGVKRFIFENKELCQKFDHLLSAALKKGGRVQRPKVREAKDLRNKLIHFKPGTDRDLFDSLSCKIVLDAQREIDDWLGRVGRIIGQQRHPNTQEIGREWAQRLNLGNKEEFYSR